MMAMSIHDAAMLMLVSARSIEPANVCKCDPLRSKPLRLNVDITPPIMSRFDLFFILQV
jgi:DNA replicative helicase MCM subunit Mcm2 (Cdc46/Mcm family)